MSESNQLERNEASLNEEAPVVDKNKFEGLHPAELDKQTGVSGVNLGELYGGYFQDPGNAKVFVDAIGERNIQDYLSSLPEEPVILGLGSGAALVECMVFRALQELGFKPKLIISDVNLEAMKEHYPTCSFPEGANIQKIALDNKSLEGIDPETINIVITRASIHYEKNKADRLQVLRAVRRVLGPGGFLINQDQAIPTQEEADLANFERGLAGRSSLHLPADEVQRMHKQVFGGNVTMAMRQPNHLHGNEEDFYQRFSFLGKTKLKELVSQVRNKIRDLKSQGLVQNARLNGQDGKGFSIIMPFQLLIAQKPKN